MGVSRLFFTMRAERTVITFRALPSMVTAKTTRTGGRDENCTRDRNQKGMTMLVKDTQTAARKPDQKFLW